MTIELSMTDPRSAVFDGDVIINPNYEIGDFVESDKYDFKRAKIETELLSIAYYESASELYQLSKRTYKDSQVRSHGGVKRCSKEAKRLFAQSRYTYLIANDLPVVEPTNGTSGEYDKWEESVVAWNKFRTEVLQNPSLRSVYIDDLYWQLEEIIEKS